MVVSPHKDNTLLLTAAPKTISFCFSFANVDVLRVLFSDTAATCVGDFEQVWGGRGSAWRHQGSLQRDMTQWNRVMTSRKWTTPA